MNLLCLRVLHILEKVLKAWVISNSENETNSMERSHMTLELY